MEAIVFPYTVPIDFETWIVIDNFPPVEESHLWILLDIDCDDRIQCKRLVESVSTANRKTAVIIYQNPEFAKWELTSFQLKLRETPFVPFRAADILRYVQIEEENFAIVTKRPGCFLDHLVEFHFSLPMPEADRLIAMFGEFSVWCNRSESQPLLIFYQEKTSAISAIWGLDNLMVGDIRLKVEMKYPSRNIIPFADITLTHIFRWVSQFEMVSESREWIPKPTPKDSRPTNQQKQKDSAVRVFTEEHAYSLDEPLINPSYGEKIVILSDGLPKDAGQSYTDCEVKHPGTNSSNAFGQTMQISGDMSMSFENQYRSEVNLPLAKISELNRTINSDFAMKADAILNSKDNNLPYFHLLQRVSDLNSSSGSHSKDYSPASTETAYSVEARSTTPSSMETSSTETAYSGEAADN